MRLNGEEVVIVTVVQAIIFYVLFISMTRIKITYAFLYFSRQLFSSLLKNDYTLLVLPICIFFFFLFLSFMLFHELILQFFGNNGINFVFISFFTRKPIFQAKRDKHSSCMAFPINYLSRNFSKVSSEYVNPFSQNSMNVQCARFFVDFFFCLLDIDFVIHR